VNKLETFIVAEVCSVYSDEDFVVEFYLEEGATGVINYTISNGVSGSIEIDSEMGVGVLELDCMPAGAYTIDAVYLGDDFYASASVSVNATIIDKPFLPLTVTVDDVDYGEDLLVFISSDRTVEVYVMLGDDEGTMFMIELVDCSGNWTYEDLDSGVYDVTVIFPGDDLFNETTVHKNATVKKINPIVEVYGAEFYYCDIGYVDVSIDGDTEIESVSVVGYPDADVSCDSDNVISISGLPVGNYVLLVTTKETTNYNSVNATGNLNVTKVIVRNDNIGEFFTSDGSLISEYPELVFEGEFSDMTFNINKPVTLLGQDATFNNARFLIDSDDVSIVNMIMNYAGNDSVVSANGVSNFNLLNNYIAYTGQASNNYAVNITDSTGILLKDNYVQASGVDYLHGIVISADNFTIDGNTLIITSAENACGINIYGPSKGAVENNELLIKAKKTVYSINTNPATGAVQVRYINNTINSEAYFVVGIYDDSEAIQDNTIILSGNYAIGIVVLSDGSNVTDNNITLNTTNNGTDDEVHDDNVDVNVTSGIVVKNNATISNNTIDSSDKAISVVEGASEISGNTLTGEVTIESSGNTISGNDMTGQVTVEGSDNIISTNVIKNNNGHAVVLKNSAVGNTVDDNECYSANGNGNDAVDDQNGGNTIGNNRVNPGLTISIAGFEEGSTSSIVITANENFTGTVNINITINGAVSQTYTVSVENGTGNTTIKGLTAGTYTAEASSVINDNFTSGQAFCNFTVTAKPAPDSGSGSSSAQGSTQTQTSAASTTAPAKKDIKLTLKTVKVKKSAKKLILKATLKINGKKVKGKVVKFKFNGKTYKAKTNKKGIAKVTIKKAVLKKLKVGKKVKYQASYGGITVKKSVKVKK
jgi:hypothetical protein